MKMTKNRRGSALLIVLGMLAFMVVSAVGFAVYMRQSRVPSSHLRREAVTRYLLKSALANAVSRLNGEFNGAYGYVEGIGDDPYPGLLVGQAPGANDSQNGDYWVKRVFTPFGQTSPSMTVSTLTLEGLAYLPPAIINEVRVHSRRTRTAQWSNLAYDLGRYAFCAVDVSDCFDINKLSKVKRRSSMAGQRISLTSLFPDDADLLCQKLASKAGSVPYISLADYNIALGNTPYTPFTRYFSGGRNGKMYLQDDADSVSNALFITDTWFPATNAYLTADLELKTPTGDRSHYFDLSKETDQPFQKGDFGLDNFLEINNISGGLVDQLKANLGFVGLTCLYDYLDKDHQPMSLALPTTEAVPMVCGISMVGTYNLLFEAADDADNSYTWKVITQEAGYNGQKKDVEHEIRRKTRVVNFKGLDGENLHVTGAVMYPFKRMKSNNRTGGSFKVQALVAAFVASKDLGTRLKNEAFRPTADDWENGGVRDGIVFYKTAESTVSFTKDIERTQDALANFDCRVDLSGTTATLPVFYHVTEEEISKGGTPLPDADLDKDILTLDGTITKDPSNLFMLFGANGVVANEFNTLRNATPKNTTRQLFKKEDREGNRTGTKQNPLGGGLSDEYNPYVVVWVRVMDGSDTVDLAPATLADDLVHFGVDYEGNEEKLSTIDGGDVPILDWRGAAKFSFDEEVLTKEDGEFKKDIEPQGWRSLFAVDPRYNFAPEDWFGTDEMNAKKETWLKVMKLESDGSGENSLFNEENRDRDIFMFTSDQETLQSIGELQFLPYVQRLGQNVTGFSGDYQGRSRYHGRNDFGSRTATSETGFANGSRFWRTYSAYSSATGTDPYYDLRAKDKQRLEVVNGTDDFRVNPLSPDPRAISAAVFDTPWDFYIASTNSDCNKAMKSAESSPEKYAFGTESNIKSDRWPEKTIGALASAMSRQIRTEAEKNGGSLDWGRAYEDLDWEGSGTGEKQTNIFNLDLGNDHPLHSVDRKFLFSYWRECFQNRQQLFLVFIRAEPLTVGGAGGDSLASSQLGARGVALVWRDPMPPPSLSASRKSRGSLLTREAWRSNSKQNAPHRTRILFYRQFD